MDREPTTPGPLNLEAISESLRRLQERFGEINHELRSPREELSDAVVEQMLSGYRFINACLHEDYYLLAMGHSAEILEVNHRVLCGEDPTVRSQFHDHIARTEKHFYATRDGGIGDFADYVALHRHEDVWRFAAGIYISILSEPQLFIEGNHRAGSLIMSYALVRGGKPPFVLTVENAKAYFEPSTLIKSSKKKSFSTLIKMPKIRRRFAAFLKDDTKKKYLS